MKLFLNHDGHSDRFVVYARLKSIRDSASRIQGRPYVADPQDNTVKTQNVQERFVLSSEAGIRQVLRSRR